MSLNTVFQKRKKNETYFRILDRQKALRKALEIAQAGDIVAVTGKGAEETMLEKGKTIPWNDKKVIQEILNA